MSRVPLLPDRKRPLIFAHRGCSSRAPENTMAAFTKARECGAPGIELDIHPTLDGCLVVAHDDTFKRTAPPDNNGGGKTLEELGYDEIRRIDVGSFFGSQWSRERPPLLETVLKEFCPAMYVDIELKSRKSKNDPLPVLLAEKLASLGPEIASAVTVSSFNPLCLKAFKKAWQKLRNTGGLSAGQKTPKSLPDIAAAVIFCVDKELPRFLHYGFGRALCNADYLKPIHKQITALSRLRWAVIEKRPLVPWTVDDPALAERLTAQGLKSRQKPELRRRGPGLPGCEGIITNRPEDIIPLLHVRQ